MASTHSDKVSSGTRNLVVGGIIAAMIIMLVFSLVGVGFAILFLALDIIASGVILFITSLLSCILTTMQCLLLRFETISINQESWKFSLLQRSCSIGLPVTIALWLIVLAINLSTNNALRGGSRDTSTQAAAVAVIAIAFVSSIALFCLIKTRTHLLNCGRLKNHSPVLPYANQQACAAVPMAQNHGSTAAGHRSLLSLRPSPTSLSAYVSPNGSTSNLSGLGIYQKPHLVQSEVRGKAHGKGSRRTTANRRSRAPSISSTSVVPSLVSAAPAPYVPHGPQRRSNHDSRSISTAPTSTGVNAQQYHRSIGQNHTPGIDVSGKPISHREHLLRKISGLDRKSSKASTGRKVRTIPSSPTLGANYDQNSQVTPKTPSSGRTSHRSKGGRTGQSQDSTVGATPGNAVGGSCLALKRSSSSLSAPRHRSPLSMVQIAEAEEYAPHTSLPQLLPELSKTNLGSIDMDDWMPKSASVNNQDLGAKPRDSEGTQVSESLNLKKTRFTENDFSFPLPPTGRPSSVITDDRFSDAEDDNSSTGKVSSELNSTDAEPGTVSTASVALQPPSKFRDMPSPLLIVKQVRGNHANPCKGDDSQDKRSYASGDGKGSNEKARVQSTSRPSTAATDSSATTAVSRSSDITALPAMPPPPPPLPPPKIWQQNSLHKRHQQTNGSRHRPGKSSQSLGPKIMAREKDSGIDCELWNALEDSAGVDDGALSGGDDLQADCGEEEHRSRNYRARASRPGGGHISEGQDGTRGKVNGFGGLDASKGMVWGGSRRSSLGVL